MLYDNWCTIDFEYTNTLLAAAQGKFPRLWEVAAVRFDGAKFESLINVSRLDAPTCELSAVPEDITADAPTWATVSNRLCEFVGGCSLYSWGLTDATLALLHDAEVGFGRRGVASLDWREFRSSAECSERLPRGLAATCQKFGIPHAKQHRALVDAKALALLIEHFTAERAVKTSEEVFRIFESS
jgi:DNA polymerase III epsilon subunit-like protein